ncbi:MAG: aspartate carbamoyltransferase catalytic subunit, partial [Rubrobacter sp.]|nr:aspartate carbamoyltransferase catalytic subunit [Rubrobacter sp.]
QTLAGKTVCLAFFEASTRTAVSFELAARRCGADVISLSEQASAISKGESLVDTVVTLDSLGADAIVLRHPAAGAASLASRHTAAPVVNAGDGCGQHPTQALLDLYALSKALGGFDDLLGRRVAIIGDVLHSRVARSVIPAFTKAGMEVALVAPGTLLPRDAGAWGLPVLSSVDEALDWEADVLYALRLQRERMTGARIPSVGEYARFYGVARRHLRGGTLVMHPGPVNRGVEISGDVVLGDPSLVPNQVAAGVPVRSAVLTVATGAAQRVAA